MTKRIRLGAPLDIAVCAHGGVVDGVVGLGQADFGVGFLCVGFLGGGGEACVR